MLSALALAVIISAFAEDIRSAQSLRRLHLPIRFHSASIALIYLDINTLPFAFKACLVYAIPFSHPVIASKAVIMGDYWTVTSTE
jgi:ABC-2 type transport system permease protein